MFNIFFLMAISSRFFPELAHILCQKCIRESFQEKLLKNHSKNLCKRLCGEIFLRILHQKFFQNAIKKPLTNKLRDSQINLSKNSTIFSKISLSNFWNFRKSFFFISVDASTNYSCGCFSRHSSGNTSTIDV